ncbi:3-carboxy-cis,cis-muconate cycloisomerase [Mesorhizobium sp. M9A.F.Ca.ET.002.03.1.2]|uniref:3-carboxy-cis,cis-muconate cycloisomerase n=1 Tax=Mesorhizobium sp. M9A.F.Ca.ET.002.03.1.2 TaxID=2493668 RepID=UPI001FDFC8CD|nr:3-carboxy-cis,cis-muconate cycloisomerase [Mesorhizobium sp. M9A.F.Ca.ET.002.03.1.2]
MASLLGVGAEITAMIGFEVALAEVEAENGFIPAEAAAAIAHALATFWPDMARLKAGTARDGVVVPDLVRQMRQAVEEPYSKHVHSGATSQDVIDTAFVLRAGACLDLLEQRLAALASAFAHLSGRFGERLLTGHTRMQPARPIRAADRIESWRAPLLRHIERLETVRRSTGVIQFGGAAGTLDAFGEKGLTVRAALAARLGLADAPQWHGQRDRVAELAGWLSLVTGGLGKFGQDIALTAQAGDEIELSSGGSSSAMPNKQNPVDAEVLVTLARYNATQLSAVHHAVIHEQERSGAAWTLEWMVLKQMMMAAGASTRLASTLINRVEALGR